MTKEEKTYHINLAWKKLSDKKLVTQKIDNLIIYGRGWDENADEMLNLMSLMFYEEDIVINLLNLLSIEKIDINEGLKFFWNLHRCLFYKRLDKWLSSNNKKLDIFETNQISAIHSAFTYWLSDHYTNDERDPFKVLEIWLDENKNNDKYWSNEKNYSLLDNYRDYLIDHRICHEDEFLNIIKTTCQELGFTYKELAEAIGYGEGAVKNAASSGKVSEPMNKAIELYMENLELKKELENSNKIKSTLKEWLK